MIKLGWNQRAAEAWLCVLLPRTMVPRALKEGESCIESAGTGALSEDKNVGVDLEGNPRKQNVKAGS